MVPFHQDAVYWNLEHTDPAATSPHTVVVWLAFTDVDDGNAALRVLPASHKLELEHADYTGEEQVLGRGVAPPVLEQWIESAETLTLRAGEISIHDYRIAHGSPANTSSRLRCGLNMTFSPMDVKGSLGDNFEAYPARGEDRFRLNAIGKAPTGDGLPTKPGGSHSSEFL